MNKFSRHITPKSRHTKQKQANGTFSHLHIPTFAKRHISTFSHLHLSTFAHLHICTLALLLTALPALAQQQDEVVYRLELGAGAGAAFNVSDVKGTPGLSGSLIARFPLNPRMAVKTQFGYAQVKGSTDGKTEFFPADATQSSADRLSYKVSSALYDLSALYELHFLPYGYERGYQGYSRIVPYIQAGFGLVYGAAGKAFSAQVPIGAGVKYKVGRRLNLGLDWTFHFSLTDKLDGLEAPLGIKATGFSNKDHYTVLRLTLTYDLNPRCPTCNRD